MITLEHISEHNFLIAIGSASGQLQTNSFAPRSLLLLYTQIRLDQLHLSFLIIPQK